MRRGSREKRRGREKKKKRKGGLAQLARAPALHAGGQEFESLILHNKDVRKRKERG